MAIIRTLEGEYYEMPDELLEKYRVPKEVVAKHASRVRDSIRIDVSKEFGALAGCEQAISDGEQGGEPSGGGQKFD
jgi:hypothetical protein